MKRILSITLILALTLCMSIAAFAQNPSAKITGLAGNLSLGYSGSTDLGEVYPQEERVEYISLTDDMFTWDDGYLPAATPTQLTPAQIRAAKLEVRFTRSNSKVVDSITLNARKSRIEVKFAKEYVGTKELDFEFDVCLSVNGRQDRDNGMIFSGTFRNPIIEVYADYDSIDISDGSVAEAQEYVSKIDVEIGDGVTIRTRMSKGKQVYGTATHIPDSGDEEVFKQHPDITEVISLHTVGLDSSGTVVKLGAEYGSYHIYNKDLEYLGAGKDELAYSQKYYLSAKKLDIATAEDESEANTEPAVSAADGVAPSTVADATPPNANHNPGTGR